MMDATTAYGLTGAMALAVVLQWGGILSWRAWLAVAGSACGLAATVYLGGFLYLTR